ncbi:MAG: multidrug effflux MFS transporter [Pseudomonadota bacterium]
MTLWARGAAATQRPFFFGNLSVIRTKVIVQAPLNPETVRYRPSTWILVLIASLSPMTMHIYLPSMPGMVVDLQTTDANIQLSLSVYLFAVANAQLIVGPLSDRFGRRSTLIAGLCLFLVATVFCRFATSIEALLVGRAFQAIGGCSGMVLSRAMVRDVSTRDTAASLLGYVTMGMAMAQMMGPAIGGFLDGLYGWRASFDLLILLGLLVLGFAIFSLRETNLSPQASVAPRALIESHRALMGEPRFWGFAMTGAFASAIFFSFLGGGPIVAQRQLGLSPVGYGVYFAFIAAGYALGNFLSGRFSARIGSLRMMSLGNLLSVVAMVLLISFTFSEQIHPLMLFGPMMISSLANGLCIPSTFSGAMSIRPDLAGTASGMAGWTQVTLGAICTVLVSALLGSSLIALGIFMLVLSIIALAFGSWTANAERNATPHPATDHPQ